MKNRLEAILVWSERFTKTDMKYLAKGGFWLVLGQGIAALTSFLAAYIFANYLDKATYGTYRFAFSAGAILGVFSLSGFGISLIRSATRGFDGSLRYAYEKSLKWHFIVVIVAFGISGYYFINENMSLALTYLILGGTIPFVNSASFYNAFLSGKKLFRESTLYWAAGNTVAVGAAVVAALLTKNAFIMTASYFLANAVIQSIILNQVIKRHAKNNTIEEGALKYGFHLSAMGALETIATHIDKALLFHYLGAAEVALFYFSLAIPDQIKAVFKSVTRLALPKFAEKDIPTIMKSLYGKMLRYSALIILGTAAYIVLAPWIFKTFFPAYLEVVTYSQILSLAGVTIIGTIPLAVLQANAKEKYLYTNSVLVNITQIILTFFFIKNYGMVGAVISYLSNRTIALIIPIVLLSIANRRSITSDSEIFPNQKAD